MELQRLVELALVALDVPDVAEKGRRGPFVTLSADRGQRLVQRIERAGEFPVVMEYDPDVAKGPSYALLVPAPSRQSRRFVEILERVVQTTLDVVAHPGLVVDRY